jgi:hypothetical protein
MNPNDQLNASVAKLNTALAGLNKAKGTSFKALTPVNTTIQADKLGKNSNYNLPPANNAVTTDNLAQTTNQYLSQAKTTANTEPVTTASTNKNKLNSYLEGIMGNISGQADAVNAINKDEDVANKKAQALSLSNDLDVFDKEYRDSVKSIKENTLGKTTAGLQDDLNRAQDRYEDVRANKVLSYNSALNDYQGASEIANSKIQALKDQNAQAIQAYSLFADTVMNDLTESEKIQVQANLQQKQTEAKTVEDAYSQALSAGLDNGAGQSYFNALDTAKRTGNVASILGTVSQYGYQTLDQQVQRSSLLTDSISRQKLLNDINPVGSTVTNEDLEAYASRFSETGTLPNPSELKLSGLTVGQVTAFAKQIPKADGLLLSKQTGVKPSSLSPTQEDGILALYDITKKTKELKELDDKRVKGLTSASFGKVFGFKDQENYIALRQEIVDLLSRARTGAALTTSEEKFYTDQLPGRVGQVGFGLIGANTQNRINNFENKIEGTLNTKLSGYGTVIQGYSTVKVGGKERTVGEVLKIDGVNYRVLPDGTLTDII